MTYFDFDFNRDKEFFKTSPTYLRYFKIINEHKELTHCDDKIKSASVKLWAESTIKHNLDINTGRVDPVNLISDANSKEIFNFLGKIMFKDRDKRKPEDYKILRNQESINNYIALQLYRDFNNKIDVLSDLKIEFLEFKNLENTKVKKIKP